MLANIFFKERNNTLYITNTLIYPDCIATNQLIVLHTFQSSNIRLTKHKSFIHLYILQEPNKNEVLSNIHHLENCRAMSYYNDNHLLWSLPYKQMLVYSIYYIRKKNVFVDLENSIIQFAQFFYQAHMLVLQTNKNIN